MSFDWSFEYPVTLDLCREDEESGRAWYLAEIEVIARIGPGPDGWKLEAWCYVGAMVDRSLAAPKVEEHVFAGRGSDPLDAAIEQRLQDHLYRRRLIIDDLWERHVRDREAVMDLRMTG